MCYYACLWTPNIRYLGGSRHEFGGVELDAICFYDFSDWFTTVTGEQVLSPDIYDLVPNEELNTGLKKVNNDEDIGHMQKDMKDGTSLNI